MGKNAYELKDVPWHRGKRKCLYSWLKLGNDAIVPHLLLSLSPVVASDRSIGGFCHSWGEDQPKVQEKKKMLEEEGIKFESDGMKIMKEHFISKLKQNLQFVSLFLRPESKYYVSSISNISLEKTQW